MKKIILIGLALAVTLIAGGAGYAKHSADVKHDRQVAAHKAKVESIQAEYRQNLAQWQTDHERWASDKAKHEKCKANTLGAFGAIDTIDGVISGGTDYNGYSAAVANVSAAVNALTRNFDLNCYSVTSNLAKASDEYSSASNIWRKWFNNVGISDNRDIEDLPLQKHWDKADSAVDKATSALNSMNADAVEPVKPTRPNLSNV